MLLTSQSDLPAAFCLPKAVCMLGRLGTSGFTLNDRIAVKCELHLSYAKCSANRKKINS